jgi:hypothetical protein
VGRGEQSSPAARTAAGYSCEKRNLNLKIGDGRRKNKHETERSTARNCCSVCKRAARKNKSMRDNKNLKTNHRKGRKNGITELIL